MFSHYDKTFLIDVYESDNNSWLHSLSKLDHEATEFTVFLVNLIVVQMTQLYGTLMFMDVSTAPCGQMNLTDMFMTNFIMIQFNIILPSILVSQMVLSASSLT